MYHRIVILLFALICFISSGQSQTDRCSRVNGTPFYECEDAYVHCPYGGRNGTCICLNTLLNCFLKIDCYNEPVVSSYEGSCKQSCSSDQCKPVLTPSASSGAADLKSVHVEQVVPLVASLVFVVLNVVY